MVLTWTNERFKDFVLQCSIMLSTLCTVIFLASVVFHFKFMPMSVEAGVPGLSKFIRTRYKTAWQKLPLTNPTSKDSSSPLLVDHLCIDMNQLLHSGFRKASNMTHFMVLFTQL